MLTGKLEAELRAALAERALDVPPGAIARLRSVDYHPRGRTVRPRVAIGALAGSASAAAATIALITLGAGAPAAFAGWTPAPAHVSQAQAAAAETDCANRLRGTPSALPANSKPVLIDIRGPFSFVIYASENATAACVAGPQFSSVSATKGPGAGVAPAGEIRLSAEHLSTRDGHPYSLVEGHVGVGVTGTTLVLDDGTKVTASIARGWFAAWWPGSHDVTSAELTTAAGTKTQQLRAAPEPPGQRCGPGACAPPGAETNVQGSTDGAGPRSGFSSVSSAQK